MPFLPYLPNIHEHVHALAREIQLEPYGDVPHLPQVPASAAEDFTATGRDAINAAIGLRTTTDALALGAQQSEAIARNTRIAAVRMLEASKAFDEVVWKEEVFQEKLKKNKLPTREDKVKWAEEIKEARLDKPPEPFAMPPKPAPPGEEDVDPEVMNMKNELLTAFGSARRSATENALGASLAAQYATTAANAAHAAAEAVNLPGLQPISFPAEVFKPPKRPRDLAPFWLDLPYAGSKGADPYMVSMNLPRRSEADLLRGTTRFNPFEGTVPFGEKLPYDQFMFGKPLFPHQQGIGKYPMDMGLKVKKGMF
mmetsp:Transcript_40597/g.71430  ORF Transcript_40597/g.71430 Transcript_40597/m.71430 type:complete len:311 (+) Transcript_40597:159-1091(+)